MLSTSAKWRLRCWPWWGYMLYWVHACSFEIGSTALLPWCCHSDRCWNQFMAGNVRQDDMQWIISRLPCFCGSAVDILRSRVAAGSRAGEWYACYYEAVWYVSSWHWPVTWRDMVSAIDLVCRRKSRVHVSTPVERALLPERTWRCIHPRPRYHDQRPLRRAQPWLLSLPEPVSSRRRLTLKTIPLRLYTLPYCMV